MNRLAASSLISVAASLILAGAPIHLMMLAGNAAPQQTSPVTVIGGLSAPAPASAAA